MEKIIKMSFILILLLSVFSCKNDKTNMDDVIDNILKVYGEKSFIEKIVDQKQVVNIQDAQGNKLKCFYYYKRPDKLKIEIKTLDGNPIIQTIYNNKRGKHLIFGEQRELTKEELIEYQTLVESWIDRYSVYEKEAFKYLKDINENGVDFHVFEVTNKFNDKHKVYVNTKSGMIDMIDETHVDVISMQSTDRKIVTKSYRKVDNISYPEKVFVYTFHGNSNASEEPMVMNLESVFHNKGIDDSEFEIE